MGDLINEFGQRENLRHIDEQLKHQPNGSAVTLKKEQRQRPVDALVSFWVVGCIEKEHEINYGGKTLDLNWADGMVGVMPVFENEAAAKKYADGKMSTFEVFKRTVRRAD